MSLYISNKDKLLLLQKQEYIVSKDISDKKQNTKVYPLHGIDNTRPTSPENIQNIINFLKILIFIIIC